MEKKLNMRGQTEIFAGKARRETTVKFYAESPVLFAQIVKENIKPGNYKMADLGGAGGGLCGNLVNLLNDYQFEIDAYDVDTDSLKENKVAKHTYHADLANLPAESRYYDISIMRYVLQWNTIEDQRKIIKEVARITKGIAIIQHCGPQDSNKNEWRANSDGFINGSGISRITRKDYLYTSPTEVEEIFKENNINYKQVQYRRIDAYIDIFIERYDLTEEESNLVRTMVADKNYIFQTTWLLDFRNN